VFFALTGHPTDQEDDRAEPERSAASLEVARP